MSRCFGSLLLYIFFCALSLFLFFFASPFFVLLLFHFILFYLAGAVVVLFILVDVLLCTLFLIRNNLVKPKFTHFYCFVCLVYYVWLRAPDQTCTVQCMCVCWLLTTSSLWKITWYIRMNIYIHNIATNYKNVTVTFLHFSGSFSNNRTPHTLSSMHTLSTHAYTHTHTSEANRKTITQMESEIEKERERILFRAIQLYRVARIHTNMEHTTEPNPTIIKSA